MTGQATKLYPLNDYLSPEARRFMETSSVPGGMFPMIDNVYSIKGKTKWFVIYTNPKCETRVKEGLRGKGFSAYVPVSAEWRRQSKREKHMQAKKVRIERPLLTRYVLVEMPAERPPFGTIRLVDGVREILGDSLNPLEVRKEVVEKIQEREASGVFDDTVKKGRIVAPKWAIKGARTRIIEGPFAAFQATIQKVLPNDIVRVELGIFGRQTLVDLELAQVQNI